MDSNRVTILVRENQLNSRYDLLLKDLRPDSIQTNVFEVWWLLNGLGEQSRQTWRQAWC